jgi:hypothetical protein
MLQPQLERLGLAGQRESLLWNRGLDGGNANETELVLSTAAITTRSG